MDGASPTYFPSIMISAPSGDARNATVANAEAALGIAGVDAAGCDVAVVTEVVAVCDVAAVCELVGRLFGRRNLRSEFHRVEAHVTVRIDRNFCSFRDGYVSGVHHRK